MVPYFRLLVILLVIIPLICEQSFCLSSLLEDTSISSANYLAYSGLVYRSFNLFLPLRLTHFLMSEIAQVVDNTLSVSEDGRVLEMVVMEACSIFSVSGDYKLIRYLSTVSCII